MDIPKPLCPLFVPVQVVLGVLPTAVSPFAALCPFPRTPVLVPGSASFSPWGGSTLILEAGDSRAAPATTHQLPNAIGGTRSSPSTRGAWPNPGGWPKTQKGGPDTAPHTSCPSPHQQPQGTSWGSPAPPSTSWGRNKRAKALFWGVLQYLAAAPARCCSRSLLAALLEQDGAEQRGGSVRPPGSPAHWC